MTESYRQMRNRQQKEFEKLPIKYAYGNKQFNDICTEWHLNPDSEDDLKKITRIATGGFCLKTDVDTVRNTLDRFSEELDAAIAADKDGTGFIYDMFKDVMFDVEYAISCDDEYVLMMCDIDIERFNASKTLQKGFQKAKKYVLKNTEL